MGAWRRHAFEWFPWASLALVLLVLALHDLPVRAASVTYTLGAMAAVLPGALGLGLFLHGNYHYFEHGASSMLHCC